MGWLFALFAVIASFGIGNLTQANSISTALNATYNIPFSITGIVITVLALLIILGGIKSISKVSQVVVPIMALFYIISGMIVIIGNVANLPAGLSMIFKMAFSVKAVGGGLCGTIVATMMQSMRYGVARGVFSNEAGMGSAAITAAAATTTDPVRQGYINMTGTFWDTIVVCTITGLCIASSGVLGSTSTTQKGFYEWQQEQLVIHAANQSHQETTVTAYQISQKGNTLTLTQDSKKTSLQLTPSVSQKNKGHNVVCNPESHQLNGEWKDDSGNIYSFKNGKYQYKELLVGSALTIKAFETVLGKTGAFLITLGIALFAFSTILGWEYHGEKALEYLLGTHKFNIIYRVLFSLLAYFGATTTLEIAWTFSDIANALMAIPNLICLLALSNVVKKELERYQVILKTERK